MRRLFTYISIFIAAICAFYVTSYITELGLYGIAFAGDSDSLMHDLAEKNNSEFARQYLNDKNGYTVLNPDRVSLFINNQSDTVATRHYGYEYVDLGLPSGNLWAVENVSGYICFENVDNTLKKQWGKNWFLPSMEDFKELLTCCNWHYGWTEGYKNKSGYQITGPNGNSIFLPADGFMADEALINDTMEGYYLTSESELFNFNFYAGEFIPSDSPFSYSVRPVYKLQDIN